MGLLEHIGEARTTGALVTSSAEQRLRVSLQASLRRRIGITDNPPPPCDDPALAYVDPASIVRVIHSDFASMLIGGMASLLLQSLHPLAMAGVSDHSRYREDPLGRLERTAMFVGTTTFRTRDEAADAIRRVRKIHSTVSGTTAEGATYDATDPHLVAWVHIAEVRSFLSAYQRYGARTLTDDEADCYVADMAQVALDLGATLVPQSVAELDAHLDAFRPELSLSAPAREARNFVLKGVRRAPHEMATYSVLSAAAQGVLPPWARRQLLLPLLPLADRLSVQPAARLVATGIRWVMPPLN